MESATEKQVQTLKNLSKNPELSQGILKGLNLNGITKQQASQLISKCFDNKERNNHDDKRDDEEEDGITYSQNYRDQYGIFKTARFTEEELEGVRQAHREHCQQILQECQEDYPEEPEIILSVFNKRCDKIYTWIQLALDEKVRKERYALRPKFYPAEELNSQTKN
jgi:hypothetical protein